MKVKELIKKLKKYDGDLPVYIADHDHGEYETNGRLASVDVKDQKDMDDWEKKKFHGEIEGPYLVLRVG